LIFQELNKKLDAGSEMLIQDVVVEASIANSEASKLASVPIRVLAASNGSFNQSVLEQLLIEEACMSAQVSDQVANLGSDTSILMQNQVVQVLVNIGVMNGLIKVFGDSCQLRDKTQGVNDQLRWVINGQQLVLVHCGEASSVHKLTGKVLRLLSSEDQLGDQTNGNWDILLGQMSDGIQSQMDDVSPSQVNGDLLTISLIDCL
jgi:hypothetical protein